MQLMLSVYLIVSLIIISVIDARTLRIPNWLTLPLLLTGLVSAAGRGFEAVVWHAATAGAIFAIMAAISQLYRHARGRDGLGMGDAKLLAAFGAWLGPLWLGPIIFLGSTLAICFVFVRRLSNGTALEQVVPFGPFLCVAFFASWMAERTGFLRLLGLY